MELHKPHAAKTWGEFFVELGTITAGILIALALEQAVESWHGKRREAEARENVRAEIGDNLGLMQVRAATEKCVSQRLDDVLELVRSSASAKPLPEPIWNGRPVEYPMRDSQYQAASQAGHTSMLPSGEQAKYASIYADFAAYQRAETAEQKAWADLRTLEQKPVVSALVDWQLRSAVQQARIARWEMEAFGTDALRASEQLHVQPAKKVRFTNQSACLPLQTSRAEALKLIAEGRSSNVAYDEP